MKKAESVKIEGRFPADALRVLRDVPGVSVDTPPRAGNDGDGDALLRFGRAAEPVAVEVKRQVNAATAWQLVQRSRAVPDANLLLVAGATTVEAREILERHGVALVDGLGNAHVELPGFLLHTEGRRGGRSGAARPRGRARLAGKAGIAAQALLLESDRAWKVQDLAGEAGISIGLAHRVLGRLEAEGVVTAEGAGPRRVRHVADPTALLDLWAEENTDRGVRRFLAYRLARQPRELAGAVSTRLDAAGIEHAVTGAAAAARIAPFVTAVPVTEVWLSSVASPDAAVAATDAELVESGHNLAFVQAGADEPLAFRRRDDDAWIVNPFRLFFDLRGDRRRGREQADSIRREVIGF